MFIAGEDIIKIITKTLKELDYKFDTGGWLAERLFKDYEPNKRNT